MLQENDLQSIDSQTRPPLHAAFETNTVPWLSGLHYQPEVLMAAAATSFGAGSADEEKEIYEGSISNGVGGFQELIEDSPPLSCAAVCCATPNAWLVKVSS